MADQAVPDTLEGTMAEPEDSPAHDVAHAASHHGDLSDAHHGRAVSWVAVSIIVVGFIAGGLGLVIGPTWWLFWTGAGIAALGGIVGLASGILDDWY
jgi:hypothetical protein